MQEHIRIPMFYQPWPHQVRAWDRRNSGKYNYYFKLWARQAGKDTDDIQYELNQCWKNPGTQGCYIGLDNVWIRANMFNKLIDGRKHWMDYPKEMIDPKETAREVYMLNNPPHLAPASVKFIGFLNDEGLIGSSYDRFTISEGSLYKDGAFKFIRPIWDRKLAMGKPLSVEINGTPRGMANVFYDLMRIYSGVDDPNDFPGEHGNCYIDKVTIRDIMVPDGKGFRPLYTDEEIEMLKSQYYREFGNLNFYYQENECEFTTVNAGLVYLAIEQLQKENRFTQFNLDSTKPVYVAFDIGSKAKMTDSTAAIIFQYYNGKMFIYDCYEQRGKALVECIAELSERPYFHLIRLGILPWDSDRSASSETPIEEARKMFPNINWHALEKERVDRGIAQVRKIMPNMYINSDNCEWLLTCFLNYQYKRLDKQDDWAAKPEHTGYSHMMDAVRYGCMGMNEIEYLQLNDVGEYTAEFGYYGGFYDDPKPKANTMYKIPKESKGGVLYYS